MNAILHLERGSNGWFPWIGKQKSNINWFKYKPNTEDEGHVPDEAVRAFAGEIQGFCRRMLDLPVCKKVQGVSWTHGHETFRRQEETTAKTAEEKGVGKRTKDSASAEVLKERYEKRQTHAGGSPEEAPKAKKVTCNGNKKVKKKKV
jgi:hypothetical protein